MNDEDIKNIATTFHALVYGGGDPETYYDDFGIKGDISRIADALESIAKSLARLTEALDETSGGAHFIRTLDIGRG